MGIFEQAYREPEPIVLTIDKLMEYLEYICKSDGNQFKYNNEIEEPIQKTPKKNRRACRIYKG